MDVDHLEFDTEMARSFGHLLWTLSTACRRIVDYAKALGIRKQLFQHFDFLRVELGRKDAYARHVATRPCQAGGEPGVHEVVSDTHDRKRLGRGLCRPPCRFSKCEDHGSAVAHQRFSESRKPVELALGEAHVEADVLAINESMLCQRVA